MTRNDRLAVFIDGANLHATAKALGFDIDFKKVLKLYKDDLSRIAAANPVIGSQIRAYAERSGEAVGPQATSSGGAA